MLVSCPDPTLSQGKGSGDHWVIPWLCRVSSLDTEQPNKIALRHATMCSTDQPIRSLVPRPHPRLCYATQVTWPMAFCWLGTTKKSLNGHQTPFLVRGWGVGTRLVKCTQGPIVYISNYGWRSSTLIVDTAQMHVPKLTGDAWGLVVFQMQIMYPCTQGKCFFSVLVCCMGSAVYLAGWDVGRNLENWTWIEDSTLQSAFLMPKIVKLLQKVYIKCLISSRANLVNAVK